MDETRLSLPIAEQLALKIKDAEHVIKINKLLLRCLKKFPDMRLQYSFCQRPFSALVNPIANEYELEFEQWYLSPHGHINAIVFRPMVIYHGIRVYSKPLDIIVGKVVGKEHMLFDNIKDILTEHNIDLSWFDILTNHLNILKITGGIPEFSTEDDE